MLTTTRYADLLPLFVTSLLDATATILRSIITDVLKSPVFRVVSSFTCVIS
jgi:hypothetical protein